MHPFCFMWPLVTTMGFLYFSLQWRHNGRDGVSDHQPHDCLLNHSSVDHRKHQISASLAFVMEIHRWPVNSPHKWPVTRKMFTFDDVITSSEHYRKQCLLKCHRCRASDPGSLPLRTRLREIIPANNCTMQEQNNWGELGLPGCDEAVSGMGVVLRWLMKFRELCSGGFHPKLVTSLYHGFLMWTLPQIVNIQNGTKCNATRKSRREAW